MPRRRPAAPGSLRCSVRAGRAELAPLRSLKHAARLYPPGPALLGAIEAEGVPAEREESSATTSERAVPAPRRRRRRVSPPRTEQSGSACLSDRKGASSEPAVRGEKRRAPGRRPGGVARQRFLVTSWGAKK